ncbi:MAG: putative hydrolase of HD superfamily [Paraglaciecola sp.]|jgi:putative hydrolase of HD superfamily
MIQDFSAITAFIVETEKLKSVERRIKPVGFQRYENSAEHSWQIALLSMTLLPYAQEAADPLTVVTMLLLHDIVEIDTGDKFAYHSNHDDFENEHAAAKRIFSLLPEALNSKYLQIWEEFEAAQSAEAKFAKAIDRLMPVLQNLHNGCQSWLEHQITINQILTKNAAIEIANPQLWQWVKQQVISTGRLAGLKD